MHKLGLIIFCICITLFTEGKLPVSVLKVAVKNNRNKTIDIIKPVNNAVFWAAREKIRLDANGTCEVKLDATQTGYVILFVQGKKIKILVAHGDTIKVKIDTSAINKISFEGENALGQTLLNDQRIPDSYYQIESVFAKDTALQLLINHVENEKKTKINLFAQLYDEKKIDKNFFSYLQLNLDYLYATVLVQKISSKFYSAYHSKTQLDKSYADYWDLVLQNFPPNHPKVIPLSSAENYIDNYIHAYLTDYKKWVAKDTSQFSNDDYMLSKLNVIRPNFTTQLADLTEARRLNLMYIQKKYEKPLIDYYNNFAKRNGALKYLPYLLPYHKEIIAYHKKAMEQFDTKQLFVKNYQTINSFSELLAQLKGQAYYVDIWATWCGPCKDEFQYKQATDDFLEKKGIKILYLSMDLDNREDEWNTMIKYYKLNGMHLRTNDSLRDDLSKVFWGRVGTYSIPRYLLISSDGILLDNNVHRPSELEELKAQIQKYFK